MREIKFRAWLKDDKKMLSVGGIDFYYRKVIDLSYAQLGNLAPRYSFDDVELMQYIGLHDKNGKEIYEGDIVKDKYGFVETVKWNEYKFEIGKIKPTQKSLDKYEYEIIGNIYDNPELLEEV